MILGGGTHVPWSPPVTYIEEVYLPTLKQLGIQAEVKLNAWGCEDCSVRVEKIVSQISVSR